MRFVISILALLSLSSKAQLSIDHIRKFLPEYELNLYSYHEQFIGHAGYGAPIILTADGGAAIFGTTSNDSTSFGLLIKLSPEGTEAWSHQILYPCDEMECMSVVETTSGNLLVFYLVHDYSMGNGDQRMACFSSGGQLLWDSFVGQQGLLYNPIIAFSKVLPDNKVELRGHIVTEKPQPDRDPVYRFWVGIVQPDGSIKNTVGEIIHWEDPSWQDKFKPE